MCGVLSVATLLSFADLYILICIGQDNKHLLTYALFMVQIQYFQRYNAFNVYCRELAPGAVSLTGDRAQGDDSKHCRDYR